MSATGPPAAGDANPAAADERGLRLRRAVLATRRGELLAPVHAVIDVVGRLLGESGADERPQFRADLLRVRTAAGELLGMTGEIFAPAGAADEPSLRSRLRHDMLNRLNTIINYAEMWLEDAPDHFLESFAPDLRMICESGRRCSNLIDTILAAWNLESVRPGGDEWRTLGDMLKALLPEQPPPRPDTDTGGRLLVVDDNETNRDILRRRLEVEGHHVTVAGDGRSALALMDGQEFDLVLLDIVMPGMDGCEVLVRLKADSRLRNVPVLMMSALDEVDVVARCIELGAEDYLTKPFNPVFLRARIGACLEKRRLWQREIGYLREIEREKRRVEDLLHVILPAEIVSELRSTNRVVPRRYDAVAVMFADIVNFTPYCERHAPEAVVSALQQLVEQWEDAAQRHRVEKIKTIGDAFMAASGLLLPAENPVLNCVRCGLEMIEMTRQLGLGWDLRVGVHSGPVVGGVLGRRTYLFDLWGDAVNTAARMESHGVPGAVTLTAHAWQAIAPLGHGQSLGPVAVKGKGSMEMVRFDRFREPARPATVTRPPTEARG